MLKILTNQQQQWVNQTLDNLSLEEAVGQLLFISEFNDDRNYWLSLMEKIPFGSARGRSASADEYRDFLTDLQQHTQIPLLVAANMEHGAAEIKNYGTDFPWAMGMGAANDADLMATMGKAIGTEARYIGINWLFNPVIDLNYNYKNPITNIRSMGDDPAKVSKLATTWLQAMQEQGVAATAKHFPGDGIDERDQHLLTTINSLPFDQWLKTFGVVWKAVIEAGVMCIMPGHISLPDYQGYRDNPEDAPPATLSRKLLIELLRQELAYEGLIVSDNAGMIGFTCHAAPEDLIVEAIASGNDIYLNANPDHDFDRLLKGVHDGRISEEHVYGSAKRVLEMKARLNLFEDRNILAPTQDQITIFQDAAQVMADKSITVLRGDDKVAFDIKGDEKVLTVTIGKLEPRMGHTDLDVFDHELRSRGLQVEHLLNPTSDELRQKAQDFDIIFINIDNIPFAQLGTVTVTDTFRTWGWRSLYRLHPKVAYTAFGSPYVVHELPAVPSLLAAYGNSDCSQRAAVKVWLGEIKPVGTLPVQLPKTEIKALPVRL